MLCLGLSLLGEAVVVGPRALSTGVPFVPDRRQSRGSGSGQSGSGQFGSGPSITYRSFGGSQRRAPTLDAGPSLDGWTVELRVPG
ncbi:MAG: hypothetical protein ACRDX8_07880 [Acidimicrobiales bacterium]